MAKWSKAPDSRIKPLNLCVDCCMVNSPQKLVAYPKNDHFFSPKVLVGQVLGDGLERSSLGFLMRCLSRRQLGLRSVRGLTRVKTCLQGLSTGSLSVLPTWRLTSLGMREKQTLLFLGEVCQSLVIFQNHPRQNWNSYLSLPNFTTPALSWRLEVGKRGINVSTGHCHIHSRRHQHSGRELLTLDLALGSLTAC